MQFNLRKIWKCLLTGIIGTAMLSACTTGNGSGGSDPTVNAMPLSIDQDIARELIVSAHVTCAELAAERTQIQQQVAQRPGNQSLLDRLDNVNQRIRSNCEGLMDRVWLPPYHNLRPVIPYCQVVDCDPWMFDPRIQERLWNQAWKDPRLSGHVEPWPQSNIARIPPTIVPFDLQLEAAEDRLEAVRSEENVLITRIQELKGALRIP